MAACRLPENIDDRLSAAFGRRGLAGIQVDAKAFAPYRFVDLFKATDDYFATRENVATIESEHDEGLNTLLHGKASRWVSRRIKRSQNIAWPVGPGEETFLLIDRFWVSGSASARGGDRLVVRLRYSSDQDAAILEVAADTGALAEAVLRALDERSSERSIYRNRLLEFVVETGITDEHGNIESPGTPRLRFKAEERVDDADIVIDEQIRQILWRNVIDLHRRREILKAHRVPVSVQQASQCYAYRRERDGHAARGRHLRPGQP